MSIRSLVIAPHPDDETIGCGGTLLRRRADGHETAWLIVTRLDESVGSSAGEMSKREIEIASVSAAYDFTRVYRLPFVTTQLDSVPVAVLVSQISNIVRDFLPTEVFVPHRGDVHTDHHRVFDASAACTKAFRFPSIKRVLAYETLSESDNGLRREQNFSPTTFVDVTPFLKRKLEILQSYESEVRPFPFPRSTTACEALAALRGATAGFLAAEAFELLRERE